MTARVGDRIRIKSSRAYPQLEGKTAKVFCFSRTKYDEEDLVALVFEDWTGGHDFSHNYKALFPSYARYEDVKGIKSGWWVDLDDSKYIILERDSNVPLDVVIDSVVDELSGGEQ